LSETVLYTLDLAGPSWLTPTCLVHRSSPLRGQPAGASGLRVAVSLYRPVSLGSLVSEITKDFKLGYEFP
jgi:hypothetical protein